MSGPKRSRAPRAFLRSRRGAPSDRSLLVLLAVVAAAFAVFARALANGFVWDDILILEKQLTEFGSVSRIFFPPTDIPQYSRFYYRPFVIVTYLADRAFGGGSPIAYHLTPIVAHCVTSGLVFLLFRRLLGREALVAAGFGALAFAVHPIHTEVAAWMAGRGDAMAAAGAVGALLAWIRWLEVARWPWLVAGAGALLFGLMSKESALIAAPLAAVLPWIVPNRTHRSSPRLLWIAIAASVAPYALLRARVVGTAVGMPRPEPAAIAELLGAAGFYARGLLWPPAVGAVRTFVPTDALHFSLGVAALLLGVAGLMLALARRALLPAWAIAWIVLGLAPPFVLLMRGISETPVADRYLYLPSLGAALLLAFGASRLPRRCMRPAVVAGAVVLAAWAIQSVRQSVVWRDDRQFWNNSAAAAPDEGFAVLKLAVELHRRDELEPAAAMLRRAQSLRLTPGQRSIVENNLGWILLRQKRFADAEPLFRSSIAVGPTIPGPYRGLAEALWPRGEDVRVRGEIRQMLEVAARIDPREARVAFLLGMVHLTDQEPDQAAQWFQRAVAANPRSQSAQQASRMLASMRGQPQ